jgi:predicted dehydrogenase
MIRIGILGAAKIAPWSIIAPAKARSDVTVTAVAARDPARAAAFAGQFGVPGVARTYTDLIERDDVDLVYVALPAAAHCEWSIRALRAGKAVLCEKPFALDAAEARQMVGAAERLGLPLIEAIHYRFHPIIERARTIVRSGELGPLVEAEGVFVYPVPPLEGEIRWLRDQGGGAIMDDGCYPLHALRTVLGAEPEVVNARSRFARGVDTETWAELRFGEVQARVHVALETEKPISRLEVRGERGRMTIRNFILPQAGSTFTVEVDGVTRQEPTDGPATYDAQLAHVMAVLDGETEPLTGGEDAVANMAAIDAVRAIAEAV